MGTANIREWRAERRLPLRVPNVEVNDNGFCTCCRTSIDAATIILISGQ